MQRYPQFNLLRALTYPLAPSPLIMILILSVISTEIYYLGPIFAVLIVTSALFALWYLKYLFLILTSTADGNPDCPILTDTLIRPLEDMRYLKLMILLLAHSTLIGIMNDINPLVGALYLVALIALLPAMIIELGIENNLLKTVHLPLLIQIVRHSGGLYWAVFAFYAASVGFILYLVEHQTGFFMLSALVLYLLMVAFHLLGVIIYERRDELGYQAYYTPEREQAQVDGQVRKRYMQVADMLYRQQCRPPALESADRLLENEPLESYDILLNEVFAWDNQRFLQRYMEHYLATYLKSGQLLKGMMTYANVLQQYPETIVIDDELNKRLFNELSDLRKEYPNQTDITYYLSILNKNRD